SDDDEVGAVGLNQFAHERADPRDKLRFAAAAIGKEGIVGDVDVARIGPHLGDLAKNGEAAEPGIKDENGRGHGGRWYAKNGRRAMSGRVVAGRARRGGVVASCGTRADRRVPRPYLNALSGHSPLRKIVEV